MVWEFAIWLLVLVAVVAVVRQVAILLTNRSIARSNGVSPTTALDQRLARGEIDAAEYLHQRHRLAERGRPVKRGP